MAKQTINVGTAADTKSGDPLRTAFTKINANFDELYAGPIIGISSGTPTSATDTGVAGQVKYDSNYVYFCISTNSWIRVARVAW